jgi:hypothetical protein
MLNPTRFDLSNSRASSGAGPLRTFAFAATGSRFRRGGGGASPANLTRWAGPERVQPP